MTYGKANEQSVWASFQKEMLRKDRKNWLYNGTSAPNGHADLGYFVGYAICKSYYDKQKDKQDALKEIIELNYGEKKVVEFLKKSGYNGGTTLKPVRNDCQKSVNPILTFSSGYF